MTLVSVIVATDDCGGIGRNGKMPWHLPEDLQRFKRITMDKPIVMGRKTWDAIGRPLPGRQNIVISRQAAFDALGATVVGSLSDALRVAGEVPEVCIIGGAEIYRLALPMAQEIHLTRVHAIVDADTFFPVLDAVEWEEIGREDRPADERHAFPYSFIKLVRAKA